MRAGPLLVLAATTTRAQLSADHTIDAYRHGQTESKEQREVEQEEALAAFRANQAETYSSATGDDLDDLWEARRGCYHASITYYQAKY